MFESKEPVKLYTNHYKCPRCGEQWDDSWDSMCDDRCPECNLTCSPESSDPIKGTCDHCKKEMEMPDAIIYKTASEIAFVCSQKCYDEMEALHDE